MRIWHMSTPNTLSLVKKKTLYFNIFFLYLIFQIVTISAICLTNYKFERSFFLDQTLDCFNHCFLSQKSKMGKAKRKSDIIKLTKKMSGLRSVYNPLPGATFYNTGIRMPPTLHVLVPGGPESRNPNITKRTYQVLPESQKTKPREELKRPITLTNAMNLLQETGYGDRETLLRQLTEVIALLQQEPNNGKEEHIEAPNVETKDETNTKLQEDGSGECNAQEKVDPESNKKQIDNSSSSEKQEPMTSEGAGTNEGHANRKKSEQSASYKDTSDELARSNNSPLQKQADKLSEPIADPTKHSVSDETVAKQQMSHVVPLTIKEFESKSPSTKKRKKSQFKIING